MMNLHRRGISIDKSNAKMYVEILHYGNISAYELCKIGIIRKFTPLLTKSMDI